MDDISFAFSGGEIFGFIGPNGAGKTTTMRIMATLDEPTGGDVFIDGCSVVEKPHLARRRIGYVPDSLPSHHDINIHEYLDFFARAHGLRGRRRSSVVASVEDFTGVTSLRHKHLNHLSKGMKQRVSLARALIHDPPLLIMDEPAAGLDPKARVELRELICALAEQGKSVFISSHILDELSEICHGVVIIEQGKLVRAGSMNEVIGGQKTLRQICIRPLGELEAVYKMLLEMPQVEDVKLTSRDLRVQIQSSDEVASDLLAELVGNGVRLVEFRQPKADLEEVFMSVTRGEVS